MTICLRPGAPRFTKKLEIKDMQVDADLLMPPVPERLRPPAAREMSKNKIANEFVLIQETLDKARSYIQRRHMQEARSLCLRAETHAMNLQRHAGLTSNQTILAKNLLAQAREMYPKVNNHERD